MSDSDTSSSSNSDDIIIIIIIGGTSNRSFDSFFLPFNAFEIQQLDR